MRIHRVEISVEPLSADDGLPKLWVYTGKEWECGPLYPRDLRFLTNIQALIDEYNGRTPRPAPKAQEA